MSLKANNDAHLPETNNLGYLTSSRLLETSSNNPIKSVLSEMRIDKTCLLCVDPQDKIPFSINLGTSIIDQNLNEQCKKVIQSKIER